MDLGERLQLLRKQNGYSQEEFANRPGSGMHCKVNGGFSWYQGYEEIFYLDKKIYEYYCHGGVLS